MNVHFFCKKFCNFHHILKDFKPRHSSSLEAHTTSLIYVCWTLHIYVTSLIYVCWTNYLIYLYILSMSSSQRTTGNTGVVEVGFIPWYREEEYTPWGIISRLSKTVVERTNYRIWNLIQWLGRESMIKFLHQSYLWEREQHKDKAVISKEVAVTHFGYDRGVSWIFCGWQSDLVYVCA